MLTLLSENSFLKIKNVSLNPTRTGILDIVRKMGAKIETENEKEVAGEPFGDIIIYSSKLKNVIVPAEIIPNIIDEIPILSVAGVFSDGIFTIKNAEELRGKETDRINALCNNYRLLGLDVEEYKDGFSVGGTIKNKDVVFESF